jgi:uncharacterized membrane protein HdeD (DUF308 family)
MIMAKDMKMANMCGMCGRCHGGMKLVAGLVFLANQFYANYDPWAVVGALLVLGGLSRMAMTMCNHK